MICRTLERCVLQKPRKVFHHIKEKLNRLLPCLILTLNIESAILFACSKQNIVSYVLNLIICPTIRTKLYRHLNYEQKSQVLFNVYPASYQNKVIT